jgi:predicted nucleic acid-binding Zn ribbon protein
LLNYSCQDCGRVFDLLNEVDAAESLYGHDCEGGAQ